MATFPKVEVKHLEIESGDYIAPIRVFDNNSSSNKYILVFDEYISDNEAHEIKAKFNEWIESSEGDPLLVAHLRGIIVFR